MWIIFVIRFLVPAAVRDWSVDHPSLKWCGNCCPCCGYVLLVSRSTARRLPTLWVRMVSLSLWSLDGPRQTRLLVRTACGSGHEWSGSAHFRLQRLVAVAGPVTGAAKRLTGNVLGLMTVRRRRPTQLCRGRRRTRVWQSGGAGMFRQHPQARRWKPLWSGQGAVLWCPSISLRLLQRLMSGQGWTRQTR